jgi:hypothetical protein
LVKVNDPEWIVPIYFSLLYSVCSILVAAGKVERKDAGTAPQILLIRQVSHSPAAQGNPPWLATIADHDWTKTIPH